jgi:hypothetical protein
VNLPDGRTADGLVLPVGEHLLAGPLQLPFDDRADVLRVTRGDIVQERLSQVLVVPAKAKKGLVR